MSCCSSTRSRRPGHQASGTLDSAARMAAALARAHLGRRDRVGVVDFGGTLHLARAGLRHDAALPHHRCAPLQRHRLQLRVAQRRAACRSGSWNWPGPWAPAISPLLDDRSIALVTELRRRGRDLTVIEVSPLDHVSAGPTAADAVAFELWKLQREALRARLQGLGIGVAVWDRDGTLGPALEGVNAFRRSVRPALRA